MSALLEAIAQKSSIMGSVNFFYHRGSKFPSDHFDDVRGVHLLLQVKIPFFSSSLSSIIDENMK